MFSRKRNKRPRLLVNGRDYLRMEEHPDHDDVVVIKVLNGDYEGVQFYFDTISITENKKAKTASCTFSYVLVNDLDLVTNKEHFESHLGRILESILETIDTDQYEYIGNNGHSEANTQKLLTG